MNKSDLMLKNKTEKTIEYRDAQNKKRQKKLTLFDPGAMKASQLQDCLDTGEHAEKRWIEASELVMGSVIINPKYSFDDENKSLKDDHPELLEHMYDGKNKNGDDIKVKMVFPDYKTALDIVLNIRKGEQDESNFKATAEKIIKHVLRKQDGTALNEDFFNFGSQGHGTFMNVIADAMEYLTKVLSHDGLLEAIAEATRFLGETLR